ncbi:MAG: putative methyl-accepting chemotaxis sensory transducer [Comamonadaceae bacterium]|nr:MAG: putative methyl-accepting chemotaxis sensory transducer [Comamonadaceae bacterium]
MKGMLDFLEKAGLVKKDEPVPPPSDNADTASAPPLVTEPLVIDLPAMPSGEPLDLARIYADQGVPASIYPAERLLRLVDGLSAMDEATRLMAIKAMDAADESWSIDDPLADAAAKLSALAAHAEQLQMSQQALQAQTQARLDAVAARQAQTVGDIRQQISELEALVERELTRAAQETATQQAALQTAQAQTARELAEITQTSQRLQSLARQFGTPNPQE